MIYVPDSRCDRIQIGKDELLQVTSKRWKISSVSMNSAKPVDTIVVTVEVDYDVILNEMFDVPSRGRSE